MKPWFADQNKKFSLFTKGRLSRLEFLRNYVISAVLTFIPFFISLLGLSAVGSKLNWKQIVVFWIFTILGYALYILGIVIGIFASVQRFHDLNHSGWRFLFFLIPIVNIVFACILLFQRGTAGDNQYGAAPQGVKHPWMPIAAALLLFAIGISFLIFSVITQWPFKALQGQLTEQIMSADASQISTYKTQTGEFPASLDQFWSTSTPPSSFFSPVDAWGNNLLYTTSSNGTFTLRSEGPDGTLNTNDDIVKTY